MIASEIITKFELQVSDLTELSSSEELDLLNDKYQDICAERPWEFLKKEATGALSHDVSAGYWYISKPEDFSFFADNNSYTDNTIETWNNARPCVVFIGQRRQPYQIVNYSDRGQYVGNGGVCWLDLNSNRIVFPVAPQDTSFYSFDYIRVPAALGLNDSPIFPDRFHKMIEFAMAVDDSILQLSPKANSYAPENNAKYEKTLALMESWNANLIMN